MGYDIIIGRDASDKEKFGNQGVIYLGKSYVKMGMHNSLSNRLWMDIARSHVVLVAGKRGSGKSHSLGIIAEELANLPPESARNIASIIFDTMGIFWTMKYENEKDRHLLTEWDLKAKKLPVKVFVPIGKASEYRAKGIPFDATFALYASELEVEDWLTIFNIPFTTSEGILITQIVYSLKKNKEAFSIQDIAHELQQVQASQARESVQALFRAAETWGIFAEDNNGTEVKSLITPATTTVLDVSVYDSAGAFNIRALVIGFLSRKIFKTRMDARKKEELQALERGQEYLTYQQSRQEPLVWIFIDEAHEFLPRKEKTLATDALVQLLREGRQPGISLVLATQQPGQIHHDVMSQSDIIVSHRVTAKQDVEALNEIMQTYLLESIKQHMDQLPAAKGAAIILDDNSERIYSMRMRPRFTWHGGEAPSAIKAELQL